MASACRKSSRVSQGVIPRLSTVTSGEVAPHRREKSLLMQPNYSNEACRFSEVLSTFSPFVCLTFGPGIMGIHFWIEASKFNYRMSHGQPGIPLWKGRLCRVWGGRGGLHWGWEAKDIPLDDRGACWKQLANDSSSHGMRAWLDARSKLRMKTWQSFPSAMRRTPPP